MKLRATAVSSLALKAYWTQWNSLVLEKGVLKRITKIDTYNAGSRFKEQGAENTTSSA